MTSEETYEHYGWMAYYNGFFDEWRKEVTNEVKRTLKEYEIPKERAKVSEQVFERLLLNKITNE
jgi:hypothetical protein